MPASRNDEGEVEPEMLTLSTAAKELWKNFVAETEIAMREGNKLSGCKDWGSKLPGKVARLAELCTQPCTNGHTDLQKLLKERWR